MKNQDVKRFYDGVSHSYDRMISFSERIASEEPRFRDLVNKYSVRSALDAGAGSGFHSILLAKCGVRVTAVDISGEMLRKLGQNAKNYDLQIKTLRSDFLKLHFPVSSFDAVFCLGNSLVHLPLQGQLQKVIKNFVNPLKPGGIMVVQILNYDRIMERKEPIQSVKKSGDDLYIRYYDFHKKQILFNLLKINMVSLSHDLHTVPIQPISSTGLKNILNKSGFGNITLYGDLTLKPFSRTTSQDLVVIADKADQR